MPPSLTTSLVPAPHLRTPSRLRTPHLSTQTGGCTKVSRPPPFPRPPVYSPPLHRPWPPPFRPPSHRAHPVSAPSPFRAYGDAKGVVRTLLPLVRGPPPSPLRACRGRRRPYAPPPLLPVRGQQSPLPGLHPTPAARPPPPLHACWGQGGQSVPPPFPFTSRPLRPARPPPPPPSPHPPPSPRLPRDPLRARPPPLHACRGGTRDGAPPLPFAGRPLHPGCTSPPSIWVPHHPRTPFCAHAGSAGRTGVRARGGLRRGCHAQGGPHVRGGPNARGPRARDGGTERWAVQPRQRTVEARRACKQGEAQPGRGVLRASGAGGTTEQGGGV